MFEIQHGNSLSAYITCRRLLLHCARALQLNYWAGQKEDLLSRDKWQCSGLVVLRH